MPYTRLADHGVLLTAEGWWRTVSDLPREVAVFGSDRAGQLSERIVSLREVDGTVRSAFVGAGSTLGSVAFGESIVSKDGRSAVTSALVESEVPAEVWLETMVRPPEVRFPSQGADSVWSAMRRSAAFCVGRRLALRCRRSPLGPPEEEPLLAFASVLRERAECFLIVDRDRLAERLDEDWCTTLFDLMGAWIYEPLSGLFRCRPCESAAVLWLLSAMQRTGRGYVLEYESRGFSSSCVVKPKVGLPAPISQVACSFCDVVGGSGVDALWTDRNWAPVVAGFLGLGR